MARARFRRIATTADCGLQVWGQTPGELFENAAAGLDKTLFKSGSPGVCACRERQLLELRSTEYEGLLISFLSELLYLTYHQNREWRVQGIFFRGDRFLRAELLTGELRERPLLEIKAVTRHDLKLTKRAGRYYLKVIFDI